jgi:hypothetical protein
VREKGRQPLSPPQHTETPSARSARLKPEISIPDSASLLTSIRPFKAGRTMDRIGEDFLPHVEVVPVAGRCAVQLTSSSGNAFFQAAEWHWRVRARAARHPGPGVLTARSKTLPPLQVRNSAQYGYGVRVPSVNKTNDARQRPETLKFLRWPPETHLVVESAFMRFTVTGRIQCWSSSPYAQSSWSALMYSSH